MLRFSGRKRASDRQNISLVWKNHAQRKRLEKAFDSVSHKFLFNVLQNLGFRNYLINIIKVAFNGCMSFANINGHLSSPIYLLRGLHQGSPLSPVLFLLVSQVLNNKLDGNPDIKGLTISGTDILTSLFADDTDLFIEPSMECVNAAIDELIKFGRYSGCKPNISKTKCIPLGVAKSNSEQLHSLEGKHGSSGNNFIIHSFSALGITLNNWSTVKKSVSLIILKNWKKLANLWKPGVGDI